MQMAVMCIKIIGSVCLISGSLFYGITKSMEASRYYQHILQLQEILMMMRAEIRYGYTDLHEIFLHLAERCKHPYDSFFYHLADQMMAGSGESLQILWEKGIHQNLSWLKSQEHSLMVDFGKQLGLMDQKMQVETILLFEERLRWRLNEISESLKERQKLSISLGLFFGIFLSICLI